jgi:hypothetical protein
MKMGFGLFVLCVAPIASVQAEPAVQDIHAPLPMEVGTWHAAIEYFEDDKPSGTATGVEVNKLLLNGHWIVNDLKVPATGKLPAYEGYGIWGYDPVAKTYVKTWVDTNDQAVRTDYGVWNEADMTMVWSSKQNDGNGHYIDYRMVEEFKGDERVSTVYQLGLAKPTPHPLLKIVFKRTEDEPEPGNEPPHRQYRRPGT